MQKSFFVIWQRTIATLVLMAGCSSALLSATTNAEALPSVVREREHAGQVVFVRVTDAGRRFVSVDYQGGIFLWDAQSLRQVSTRRRVPFSVKTAGMLDARTMLVAGSAPQDLLALVDLEGTATPRVLGRAKGETVAISGPLAARRVRAVIANDTLLRVVEINSNGLITDILKLAKTEVSAVAISGDGQLLAYATRGQDLVLVDVATGATRWKRQVDAMLTSLSIAPKARVLLGAYDNVLTFKFKRIDMFSLESGLPTRQLSTEPCSVLQVDVLDSDQGFAICGPSMTDNLVNMSKQIRTSFITWSLSLDREVTTIQTPGTGPGSLSYLPFRAGASYNQSSKTILVGGGDGSLFAARLPTNGQTAAIERLAPIPQVSYRFAVGATPRKLMVISNLIGRNGRKDDATGRRGETTRAAIASSLPNEHFTDEELREAIDPNGTFSALTMANGMRSWDVESGSSDGMTSAGLGYVLDVVPAHRSRTGSTMAVEVMAIESNSQFEPTVLSVAQVSEADGFEFNKRRLYSIDSLTGLLKPGIRRNTAEHLNFNLSVCPTANIPGNVRLSADARLLTVACLTLPKELAPKTTNYLNPNFELLTYWDDGPDKRQPARIPFTGSPIQIELSSDGGMAAILTLTQSRNADRAAPSIDNEYALTIVDTVGARLVKTIPRLPEPPTGRAMAFSRDAKQIYLALGFGVYRYDIGTDDLVVVNVKSEGSEASVVATLALNEDGALLAVSRYSGVTEVYRLDTLERANIMRHTGETMIQLVFDFGPGTRLFAASDTGGIELFDYVREEKLADFLSYEGGEWITVSPDGVFSASIGGELGVTVSDGQRAVSVDQLYDLYFRPEMLRLRIAGARVEVPSASAVRHSLSMPPPTLEVALTPANSALGVVAAITIHNAGGGIGGLRAFHNGKLALELDGDALRNLTVRGLPQSTSTYRVKLSLPASAGANEYMFAAMNEDRSLQSRFVKVTSDRPKAPTTLRKAYVLLIGSNSFEQPTFPVLSLAENSSRQLGEAFRRTFASIVGASNVEVMDLVGEASRYQSVERALDALERAATPDDIVAVVITTHGKVLPSGEMLAILKDTAADNSRSLTTSRLIASMSKIQALTQVLVLDICHAGVLSEKVSAIYQERFAVFAGRAGIHVMASTSAEEPALATFAGTTVFSHFLIQALAPRLDPAAPQRSLRKAANAAKDQVKATALKFHFNQVPAIYSFGRDLSFP
jgi:WD40 repeat protein